MTRKLHESRTDPFGLHVMMGDKFWRSLSSRNFLRNEGRGVSGNEGEEQTNAGNGVHRCLKLTLVALFS